MLLLFVLVASVGTVASDDSGSGSIAPDDGSPTDDYTYSDDSNSGSLDSEEDDDEDPLDEEVYDSEEGYVKGDDSVSVNLSEHATANPVLILILSLMSAGGLLLRR